MLRFDPEKKKFLFFSWKHKNSRRAWIFNIFLLFNNFLIIIVVNHPMLCCCFYSEHFHFKLNKMTVNTGKYEQWEKKKAEKKDRSRDSRLTRPNLSHSPSTVGSLAKLRVMQQKQQKTHKLLIRRMCFCFGYFSSFDIFLFIDRERIWDLFMPSTFVVSVEVYQRHDMTVSHGELTEGAWGFDGDLGGNNNWLNSQFLRILRHGRHVRGE